MCVVLSLIDVPKTISRANQNGGGGAQAAVKGGHGSPSPPVATALLRCGTTQLLWIYIFAM